mmetsp:Transcript_15495/g.39352  ORF Transcript_15495/g.39352 Transcript_15495/m.39352 type:complete len:259 (-) Transcript_15495:245-1021(-)
MCSPSCLESCSLVRCSGSKVQAGTPAPCKLPQAVSSTSVYSPLAATGLPPPVLAILSDRQPAASQPASAVASWHTRLQGGCPKPSCLQPQCPLSQCPSQCPTPQCPTSQCPQPQCPTGCPRAKVCPGLLAFSSQRTRTPRLPEFFWSLPVVPRPPGPPCSLPDSLRIPAGAPAGSAAATGVRKLARAVGHPDLPFTAFRQSRVLHAQSRSVLAPEGSLENSPSASVPASLFPSHGRSGRLLAFLKRIQPILMVSHAVS